MVHLVIRYAVEDYDQFKEAYNESQDMVKRYGQIDSHVFREWGAPNLLTLLTEFDSVADAEIFLESDEFKELMQKVGILAEPSTHFMTEDKDLAFSTQNPN